MPDHYNKPTWIKQDPRLSLLPEDIAEVLGNPRSPAYLNSKINKMVSMTLDPTVPEKQKAAINWALPQAYTLQSEKMPEWAAEVASYGGWDNRNRDRIPISPERLRGAPTIRTGGEMREAQPDDPVLRALDQFKNQNTGTLADTATSLVAAMPGLAGDVQALGDTLGIGPQAYLSNFGLKPLNYPETREIAEALGGNPDTKLGFAGELLSPLPNELVAAGNLAGPLLHASPFKFDFFDLENVRKGEGFTAYSGDAIYFSDTDLVKGTHPGYLSQFKHHKELKNTIGAGGNSYVIDDIFKNMEEVDAAGGSAEDTVLFNEFMRDLGLEPNADPWQRGQVYQSLRYLNDYDASVRQLNHLFGIDKDVARLFTEKGKAERIKELQTWVDKWQGLVDSGSMVDAAMEQRALAKITEYEDWIKRLKANKVEYGKAEPYSYLTHFRDDIEHELPIYNDPIKDQPERFKANVEELARSTFDEEAVKLEIKEAQEGLDEWLNFHRTPQGLGDRELDLAAQAQIEYIKTLERQLEKGANLDRTFGELVQDLKAEYGERGTTQLMLEYGIPGSRNETYRSRQKTASPMGALAYLSGKRERGFNYAIWDFDYVDEIVRRQTKDGKILEDTAETVYRRQPDVLAYDAANAPVQPQQGFLRFRHFGRKGDVDALKVDMFGTGIKGAERARNPVPTISAYPDTGFIKEAGLGPNEFVIDVPQSRMYDLNADPDNLKALAQEPSGSFHVIDGKMVPSGTRTDYSKLERIVKDQGYLGYYTPDAEGNLRGQARFFGDIPIKR